MDDVVIINGRLWSGTGEKPFLGTLVIREGVIREIKRGGYTGTEGDFAGSIVLDAKGGSVIPSFTDAHVHCASYVRQKLGVDLSRTTSMEEALDLLRKAAEEKRPDQWIYGKGLNENNWKERRLPTKEDLKDIIQPVLLMRICCHVHIANDRAMQEAGIDLLRNIKGACRTPEGELNGILEENAALPLNKAFEESLKNDSRLEQAFDATFQELLSLGIGEFHTVGAGGIGLGEDAGIYQTYRDEGRLPLRTVFYFDSLPSLPIRSGFGDSWISYGGFKIFLDGSLGGRTAALCEPYVDKEGRGILLYEKEDLEKIVSLAAERDIQLMAHAIGDAAIDLFLDVLEKLRKRGVVWKFPVKATHMQVCSPENVNRAGALGLFCDVQPHQIASDILMAPQRLGEERSSWCFPLASLKKAGAILVGSSDCPVEPLNPLLGIQAAMLRKNSQGFPETGWNPAEALSLEEGLEMYTLNPQKLLRRDFWKGSLERGKVGDVTVFNQDLFATAPEDLGACSVKATVVGGKIGWSQDGAEE